MTTKDGISTKRGLLWRGGQVIHLPEADLVAQAHGFHHAEAMVRELESRNRIMKQEQLQLFTGGVAVGSPPPGKNVSPKSPKQGAILAWLSKAGAAKEITLDVAVGLIGKDIYHNAHKHCGALLSNMVKRGMLARVKPGVYKLP